MAIRTYEARDLRTINLKYGNSPGCKRAVKHGLRKIERIKGERDLKQEIYNLVANRMQMREGPIKVNLSCAYVFHGQLIVEGEGDHLKVMAL